MHLFLELEVGFYLILLLMDAVRPRVTVEKIDLFHFNNTAHNTSETSLYSYKRRQSISIQEVHASEIFIPINSFPQLDDDEFPQNSIYFFVLVN